MPKISALLANAANADTLFAPNRNATVKKADRESAFDEMLSGARRKSEPPREKPVRADATQAKGKALKAKPKPAKNGTVQENAESSQDLTCEAQEADGTVTAEGRQPQKTQSEPANEAPTKSEKPSEKKAIESDTADAAPDMQLAAQVVDPNAETVVIAPPEDVPVEAEDAIAIQPTNEKPVASEATEKADLSGSASQVQTDLAAGTVAIAADTVESTQQSAAESPSQPATNTTQSTPITPPVSRSAAQDGGAELRPPVKAPNETALSPAVANAAAAGEAIDPDVKQSQTAPQPASPVGRESSLAQTLENFAPQNTKTTTHPAPSISSSQQAPEARFADDNHPTIVAGVRGQLMPNGGTMHIRLDPPELGPLAVTVRLRGGVMEASFETQSDEAARLLSHSLGTLKSSLESQGVNVERLHVQQSPKSEQSNQNNNERDGQQGQDRNSSQDNAARQDHQRREMLRRMWRKLTGIEDPLDMVA